MFEWARAMAIASLSSGVLGWAVGNKIWTILSTELLSAWPAPVRAFFILFGSYSKIGMSWFATATIAAERACPSINVVFGFLFTKAKLLCIINL